MKPVRMIVASDESHIESLQTTNVHHIIGGLGDNDHDVYGLLQRPCLLACLLSVLVDVLEQTLSL